ncbi:hypothetical protein PSPO01_05707, partial [Paraphaeosphaeria sporulosa]
TTADIETNPIITRSSAATEAATSQSAHESDTIIDTAPTRLGTLTTTLLVGTVPAQATQTAACVQFGHSCKSMVVAFAPLVTPAHSPKEGTPVTGHAASSTTFAASSFPPPAKPWPTQTLHVAANIMPSVNPMTIACSLGHSNDVDCNEFASIIMTVMPMPTMPLSEYKTFITHAPIEHAITESSGAQAAPTPSAAVPQVPPINVPGPSSPAAVPQSPQTNVPVPVPTLPSITAPVATQPRPAQNTPTVSSSAVSPTGWLYGPPPRPDLPPPFGKGETPSAPPSVAHEGKSSVLGPAASTTPSTHISSATVVSISPRPYGPGRMPISSLPSGTGSVTSSASLVPTSTLATTSSPMSSAGSAGNGNRPGVGKPGMGDHSIHNTASAATSRFPAPWLLLLISLYARILVMS